MSEVDSYNIFAIGIDIIEFHIKIISKLVFSLILHLFLFHIFLESDYYFHKLLTLYHKMQTHHQKNKKAYFLKIKKR